MKSHILSLVCGPSMKVKYEKNGQNGHTYARAHKREQVKTERTEHTYARKAVMEMLKL